MKGIEETFFRQTSAFFCFPMKLPYEKELIPVSEEAEIVKSEPPSPTQLRSEPDSFLAEVVEGAKGLNIDLSAASITTPLSLGFQRYQTLKNLIIDFGTDRDDIYTKK